MNEEIKYITLESIYIQLIELNKSIIMLKNDIEILTKKCSRMDSHINFVEETYDTLKHPLNYITEKVSQITGNKKII